MPQMAPMLWCLLFFYFILLLSSLMSFIFFNSFLMEEATKLAQKSNGMSWKW